MRFGLFEKVAKCEVRVSQAAVDSLHPDDPDQRKTALVQSAFTPGLFSILRDRFADGAWSLDALRSYLMKEIFNDRAIGPVISSYTKPRPFLEQENASKNGGQLQKNVQEANLPDAKHDEHFIQFGGAKVGDLIEWNSGGALQFESPRRVRLVTDDRKWIAVVDGEMGIPMEQVIVEDSGASTPSQIFKIAEEPTDAPS
ncbi:MAG: hypothetical protein AAGF44_00055 [Pseudomonadota bacterium]